jgi:hypothetical protein
MMSTLLGHDRIVAYVLDPEGDDELWQGAPDDLDEEPEELNLSQTPEDDQTAEREPAAEQLTLFPGTNPAAAGPSPAAIRSAAQIYPIPAERSG